MGINQRRDLYASLGASVVTSETYWTGDAEALSLFLDSTSNVTIQANAGDGRAAALAEADWSDLSVVATPTLETLDIEPGFRWMRVLTNSSSGTAILSIRNHVR